MLTILKNLNAYFNLSVNSSTRHSQLTIYTVFDEESDVDVQISGF